MIVFVFGDEIMICVIYKQGWAIVNHSETWLCKGYYDTSWETFHRTTGKHDALADVVFGRREFGASVEAKYNKCVE